MKLSKWVILVSVLMVSMVGWKIKGGTDSPIPENPNVYDTEAMVLAAYQVWHGSQSHRSAFAGEPMLPNERPYDSRDAGVISRHIREAKERGISGFVVDWYGPKAGVANDEDREFQDQATAELFTQAETKDFFVALMYDDQTVKAESDSALWASRVKSDLLYAERYFASSAYLTINERPALFIFPNDEVKPFLNWGDIRDHLNVPVTLIDRDPNPAEPEYDADFDGFFAWVTANKGQWRSDGLEWGREYLEWFYATMQWGSYADKVAVGGVWPGFDDSLAPWSENRFMTRSRGKLHMRTFKIAEYHNVDYIMVGTWNDFEEGTDIEYGVRMSVVMEKEDPELLLRSTPVMVDWSADIGSAPFQVYKGGQLIYDQYHSPGVYLSLTPGAVYELKIWTSGTTTLNNYIKIRRHDPIPDVTPVVVE